MKARYNIYGSGWNNLEAARASESNSSIEWVLDGSALDSFYPNTMLDMVQNDTLSRRKYAILNESVAIDNISHDLIYRNIEQFDMIFTHNKKFYGQNDKIKFIPASVYWIERPKIHSKNRLVSMITSNKMICDGHRTRLEWAKRLSASLDLFGNGFNPIDKKEFGLNKYMFSVAIENAFYETYFTEKILDCFATGTIPIYLGSPDIGDFFNKAGIIILNDEFDIHSLNEDLYYSKLDAIKENFELVLEYNSIEDYMYRKYLHEMVK